MAADTGSADPGRVDLAFGSPAPGCLPALWADNPAPVNQVIDSRILGDRIKRSIASLSDTIADGAWRVLKP